MITFRFDADVKGVLAWSAEAERQMPYATVLTLNRSARDALGALQTQIRTRIDRPRPWTVNSLYVKPARKTDLTAQILFREFAGGRGTPAGKYLRTQEEGGPRGHKRFEGALRAAGLLGGSEFAVPGPGAKLDAEGNITGGTYTAMLSQLGASRDATQNVTAASQKRRARRGKPTYFVAGSGLGRGVWRREGGILGKLFSFIGEAPRYRPRLEFYGTAQKVFDRVLPGHFRAAMAEALRTARR